MDDPDPDTSLLAVEGPATPSLMAACSLCRLVMWMLFWVAGMQRVHGDLLVLNFIK